MMRAAAAIACLLPAAVILGACATKTTAAATGQSPRSVASVGLAAPSPTTQQALTGPVAPAFVPPPPDAQGNPACPVSDAWGKDASQRGIFISYWADGTDDVTVLVHIATGTDYGQSAKIGPYERLHLFDFPDIDARTVQEVLITTNVKRCFATPDPATSGR
jgi:hypothetical protein